MIPTDIRDIIQSCIAFCEERKVIAAEECERVRDWIQVND
jgi:hypothetical protein